MQKMPGMLREDLLEPLRAQLAKRPRRTIDEGSPSAVLIALFMHRGEMHTWLVRRPETMRSHRGQVAFPGGKFDETDPSLLATALREAEEEIGLPPTHVDVLGALDDYPTFATGYRITPYVGWVSQSFDASPNEHEVARLFSAPVHLFAGPVSGDFPRIGFTHEGEFVWGATAAIGRDLAELMLTLARR